MQMHRAIRLSLLSLGALLLHTAAPAQTTVAGFIESQFQVTDSGAASLAVPIDTPPGVAAVEPKLAFTYNSQAGNGRLGVGWTLDGVPAIERCARSNVQDSMRAAVDYSPADRYCFNGQRLVSVVGTYGADGAEYRTERESFTRFFSSGAAGNGPGSWSATTKAGVRMDFGATADARIEAIGKTSVRVYAVNKMHDHSGNYLTVTYAEDADGDYRPTRIDYTGNGSAALAPFASVSFVYESRPDPILRNVAGSDTKIGSRLQKVQTFHGATMVKEYRLAYDQSPATGRSRLVSITECNGDATQCLVPLQFTYSTYATAEAGTWVGQAPLAGGWRLVDLFGDGRQVFYTVDGTTHNATRLSPGGSETWSWTGGQAASPTTNWEVADLFGDGKKLYYTQSGTTHYATRLKSDLTLESWSWIGGQASGAGGWKTADLFGDGRQLFYTHDTFGTHLATRLNSDGTSTSFSWAVVGPANTNWRMADLFGDGRQVIYWHSGNTHFATRLNADGSSQTWQWTDPGFSVGIDWRLADLFGEGRELFYTNWGNGTHTATRLNTDGTFQKWNWTGTPVNGNVGWELADVLGIGRQVYTTHSTDGTHVAVRFNSDSTFATWTWTDSITANNSRVMFGDLFGSGRSVYHTNSGSTHYASSAYPLANTTVPADVITQLAVNIGAQITVGYRALTDAVAYTKDTDAVYPAVDFQGPLYVVRDVTQLDGAGGSLQATHSYTGAKLHLTGGGFLGFRKVDATEAITGIKSTTTSRLDYPFQGLPTSTVKTQPSGAVLNQVANTWTDTLYPSSTGGNHHRTDLTQSVVSGNDLNGSVWPTVTTTTAYDTYGSATSITVSTGDGNSKATTNTYSNTVTPTLWLPGRLTRSSIVSTIP